MKLTYAQECEISVAKLTGGKITPGSGNKRVKGDVITSEGGRIEVKSTIYDTINIQYEWLEKLEHIGLTVDVCLVIVFGDGSMHVYYPDFPYIGTFPRSKWSTIKVKKDAMPLTLNTERYNWCLDDSDSLKYWLK